MTLTFFTNYINHHQVPVADEIYKVLGNNYTLVAMESLPQSFKDSGYPDFSDKPYLLKAYENDINRQAAYELAFESDVVIIGSAPEDLVKKRLHYNKITFHYHERWFKKNGYHLLSPRALWCWYQNHIKYRNFNSYMLAASAYTANDAASVFAYPNKCYKWGYFPKIDAIDMKDILLKKRSKSIQILWCARFLKWKHPELAIKLAKFLKEKKYDFHINMLGVGEEMNAIRKLVTKLSVEDKITFLGNQPNDEVLKLMRNHHIFIFTSDRNEGWGAVLNEAMSNGCTVVASNQIGAVPFLMEDGVNGCIFKSEDLKSLAAKVESLMLDTGKREQLACNAYLTMKDIWSPQNAASNLLKLTQNMFVGDMTAPVLGPCSKATCVNSTKIIK